jgi:2-polyprenyl-3-methyl-5-hydroxy-6-metoxy-1,4-benzoquinol methylase
MMIQNDNIDNVRYFWEKNPLWTGESKFETGSIDFFEEHRNVIINDCLAGSFDLRFLPDTRINSQPKILDLGCGVGFWVSEIALRGLKQLYAADLTENAISITKKRLEAYQVSAELSIQNAENMSYKDDSFDYINCQGVIHHTPDTEAAVAEIARVLKPGGTAVISVYYRNIFISLWPYFWWIGVLLSWLGGGLKGRGREKIFREKNVDNIVRMYDGLDNPIGKIYTKEQFISMLGKHFNVKETFLHFFPARSLPFKIPHTLHRWLDKHMGFMIYTTLQKPCVE